MITMSVIVAFVITTDLIMRCFDEQRFVGFVGCEESGESRFGLLCKIEKENKEFGNKHINPFYWTLCSAVGVLFVCILQVSAFASSAKCQSIVIAMAFFYFIFQIMFVSMDQYFSVWNGRRQQIGDGIIACISEHVPFRCLRFAELFYVFDQLETPL